MSDPPQNASHNPPPPLRTAVRLLPAVVLAVTLGATYLLWRDARQEAERELQTTFDFRVREAALRIRQRMLAYEQVLRGVQGLFAASHKVERSGFREYVAKLRLDEIYPGIQGVDYCPWVPAPNKQRHIETVRGEGLPAYAITPDGERPGYAPLIYLEPERARSGQSYGFDPYADPEHRAAMDVARDSGNATISGRIGPEESGSAQAGVAMYLPVYRYNQFYQTPAQRRTNLAGWISSVFAMDDLVAGILGEHGASLDIEIYDGLAMNDQTLLYDTDSKRFSERDNARYRAVEHLPIGGHFWLMAVSSQPAFDARLKHGKAQVVAVAGAMAGVLLTLLTWLLIRGRERAVRAAWALNRELAEREKIQERLTLSEERWRFALEGAGDGVWDWNLHTGDAVFTPRWKEMLGFAAEEIGIHADDWLSRVHPEDLPRMKEAIGAFVEGRSQELKFEQRIRCKDNSWKWTLARGMVAARDATGKPLRLTGTLTDISETRRLTEKLQQSHNLLEKLSEQVPGVLCQFRLYPDGRTRIPFASQAFAEVYELNPEEVRDDATPLFNRTHPDDYGSLVASIHDSAFNLRPWQHEFRVALPRQGIRWRLGQARPERLSDGSTLWHGFVTDITERHEREEALRLASTVFDIVDEALMVTDPDNHIIGVNPAFSVITSYSAEEVMGRDPRLLSAGTQPAAEFKSMWDTLQSKGSWQGEIWNRKKNGEVYVVWMSIKLVRDAQGHLTHHVAVFSDISERKAREANIIHQAHHDPLTDLPNRALFGERLQQALLRARREGTRMALMFLDLDKFKPVNDSLGHAVGDLLLKEVARRLEKCVRESDIVARIGGDEFVVLLPAIAENPDALRVSLKIIEALETPFEVANHTLNISGSIGIALYPDHGEDERTLVKHADIAMYHAKHNGRGQALFYQAGMREIGQ